MIWANWSSGNCTENKIPEDGEDVIIQTFIICFLDQSTANLGTLQIKGELYILNNVTASSLILAAGRIIVSGKLQAGTEEDPLAIPLTIDLSPKYKFISSQIEVLCGHQSCFYSSNKTQLFSGKVPPRNLILKTGSKAGESKLSLTEILNGTLNVGDEIFLIENSN